MALAPALRSQTAATFGEVIALGATPADIVLDESRQRLYLVNSANSRVDVWDYANKKLLGSISVGQTPLGAAMTMDNSTLYVANHDSSNLSVISLSNGNFGSAVNTVALPAKPQGVAVGADGRAVICTDGSGTSSTANTLLIYDSLQATSSQVIAVPFPPAPATPPALAPTTTRVTTQFNGKLIRTPDGLHIVGVSSITNNTSTVVYVYEPASGTILYSRTVTGQSSNLSMAPDGSRFMAGFTLYDFNTLNVIAQQSTATAPFSMGTANFSTVANVGGSVFSPDGTTLYSAFNTAPTTTPPQAPQASTLLISDPRSLKINLGINLPESVLAKMVMTQDGNDAWALSASGVIHLPLSTLYNQPILAPSTTTVFLRQDDCNPGVAQGSVTINNTGGGRMTFAVPSSISGGSAALIANATSGVAPSTITFTMDPGRSGVIRTPGTNLYTGGGATNTGSAVNIQLVSPEAINVPPTIRVYMNYRDSTMRGVVYPVPTAVNSTATSYQGLSDIVLDQTRNRVYITNEGYNRIEVFDTVQQQFQAPILVGPQPLQMAMGLDGSTLYVAHAGGESIQMVDLDAQQVIGSVQFPPVPRAGNANVVAPVGIAATFSGLEIVMNNGTLWEVINGIAVPRTPTSVTGVATTGAQTPIATPPYMLGADDGSKLILLGGSGTAYLYDGLTDAYTSSQKLFGNTTPTPGFGGAGAIIGYYGPLGSALQGNFFLANGLVLNSALTAVGGAAAPGQVSINPPAGPGQPPSVGVTSTGLRNIAAVAPVGPTNFLRMSTPVRTSLTAATSDDVHTTLEAVDVTTGATALAARMPENPVLSEFNTTRTAMTPRQMVVGSDGTVYALTLSGLSVVPLTIAGSDSQPQIASSGGVMNADGTSTFQPGSFIVVNGTNLASSAAANTLPPPTVLGGSCVLVDNVPLPLLTASPTQIGAQIPSSIRPGVNVLEVRSLATAQRSTPVVVTLQKPQ